MSQEEATARNEVAMKCFNEGFRCSQSVLEAWAKDFGLDPLLGRKISAPLAGGSAVGGECGAVSGAFLVIGMRYTPDRVEDLEGFMKMMARVREFADSFKARHGSLNCSELLGLDVLSEQGHGEFKEKNMKETHCVRYVEDAMNLLEEAMGGERR